jgi:hypothetical protein
MLEQRFRRCSHEVVDMALLCVGLAPLKLDDYESSRR